MFTVKFKIEGLTGYAQYCFKDFDDALKYAKKMIDEAYQDHIYDDLADMKIQPEDGTLQYPSESNVHIVGYSIVGKSLVQTDDKLGYRRFVDKLHVIDKAFVKYLPVKTFDEVKNKEARLQ